MDFWTAAAYWSIVVLVVLNAWIVSRMRVEVREEAEGDDEAEE
jgi:hypothetical protein